MRELQLQGRIESVLLHALNNVGKSHLLGSALVYERQFGPCLHVSMLGEPATTLLGFDLDGVRLVEVETADDVITLANSLKDRLHCITFDSIQRFNELCDQKVTGGAYKVGSKEDHGRDWAKLKYETFKGIEALKKKCELFIAVCPSNLHENAITKQNRVIPDVSGAGEKIVGRFNFAGYLEAVALSPTKTQRKISFHQRLDAVTRWNGVKPIHEPIVVPDGKDCWVPIRKRIDEGLTK